MGAMAGSTWQKALLAAAALGFATIGWQATGVERPSSGGQKKDAATPKSTPALLYAGVSACRKCHTSAEQVQGAAPDLCRCNEVPIWEKQDKHKLAYVVLESDRAKQMGKLLGWNVKEDQRCLSCHGVVIGAGGLLKESEAVGFDAKDGVSCVVCHGPYAEWVDMHGGVRRPVWRKLSRQEKQDAYGMTDLWNPGKRAELCTSCHIGSTQQGKFVTHAMYAAGHPPLPSIELATFSEEMPRHWQYIREKPPQVQELLKFKNEEARWEQSKVVVVSGAVAVREALNLLATQAEKCAKSEDPRQRSLDYALFDCAACHHELKYPGWRQTRGYLGKPGRPQLQAWPTTLAKIGVSQAGEKADHLDAGMKKLAAAFDVRPFGDPGQIAAQARELVRLLDPTIQRLNDSKFDQKWVEKLREALTGFKDNEYPDYEEARQRAWAFVILSDELAWKEQSGDEQKKAYRQRLERIDKQLNRQLMLTLPSGQNTQILDKLSESLKRMGDYDPRKFVPAFRSLGKETRP